MLTLRNRLVLVNVLVFLLTFVVLVGVLAGQLVGHLFEQLDRSLVESAERAAARVVIHDGEPRLADREGRLGGNLGWRLGTSRFCAPARRQGRGDRGARRLCSCAGAAAGSAYGPGGG